MALQKVICDSCSHRSPQRSKYAALTTIVLGVLLTIVLLPYEAASTQQSKDPIEKVGLIRALRKRILKKEALVKEVVTRGVSFQLTPAIEREIRTAGGYLRRAGLNELIVAVRNSYRRPEAQGAIRNGSMSVVGELKMINPNGPWSYGWTAFRTPDPGLTLFNVSTEVIPGVYKWYVFRNNVEQPSITVNSKKSSITYAGVTHPPHLLNLHPGPKDERAVVRWTAPMAGTYHVGGRFEGIANQDVTKVPATPGTTSDVVIKHNYKTPLFNSTINKYGAQAPFSIVVTMANGDTLDFSVGSGDDYGDDSTGLTVMITPRP